MKALSLIPVASYVFLGLFLASSIWHIYLCIKGPQSLRKATKCFCVLFLAIAVAIAIPQYPLIYIGLLCGVLGDFFLLFKKKVFLFVLGTIFFMVNHTLCIIQILIYLSPLPLPAAIGVSVYYAITFLISFLVAKKMLKKKRRAVPASFYMSALWMNIGVYTMACFMGYVQYFLICLIGAISFFASDLLLAYSLFVKGNQASRHLVMGSYLIAQLFISMGFIMTFIL